MRINAKVKVVKGAKGGKESPCQLDLVIDPASGGAKFVRVPDKVCDANQIREMKKAIRRGVFLPPDQE